MGGSGEKLNMTTQQAHALSTLVSLYTKAYPDAEVRGHYENSNKRCPGFWVPSFCRAIRVPEKNISFTRETILRQNEKTNDDDNTLAKQSERIITELLNKPWDIRYNIAVKLPINTIDDIES